MNECKALPSTTTASREANVKWPVAALYPPVICTVDQGLTLVHFLAQIKRFLWDRGCI